MFLSNYSNIVNVPPKANKTIKILPDIVIIVDQQEEYTALRECIILGIRIPPRPQPAKKGRAFPPGGRKIMIGIADPKLWN
jgi:hypothetical protein